MKRSTLISGRGSSKRSSRREWSSSSSSRSCEEMREKWMGICDMDSGNSISSSSSSSSSTDPSINTVLGVEERDHHHPCRCLVG